MPKRFLICTLIFGGLILTGIPAVPFQQPANQNQPKSSENPQYKLSVRSNLVLVPVIPLLEQICPAKMCRQ